MASKNLKLVALILLLSVGLGCQDMMRAARRTGTVFTIEVETDEPDKRAVLGNAASVLRTRLRAIGVDGEVRSEQGNRIIVKIYGSHDLDRIKKFLFTANQLELKKVVGSTLQIFKDREAAQQSASAEQEVLSFDEAAGTAESGFIVVEKEAVINGADISDAQTFSPDGAANNYSIAFTLNPQATRKFGDWTGKNIGTYLAIVLDKKALSAPSIRGQIFDKGSIDGRFSKATAEDLALSLRSGYLPATMKIVKEEQVEYPFYRKD